MNIQKNPLVRLLTHIFAIIEELTGWAERSEAKLTNLQSQKADTEMLKNEVSRVTGLLDAQTRSSREQIGAMQLTIDSLSADRIPVTEVDKLAVVLENSLARLRNIGKSGQTPTPATPPNP